MTADGKRARDVVASDIDNGESILVVISLPHLLVLDLNGNRSDDKRPCYEPGTELHDEPVLLKQINFKSLGLPENMGVMRLGKKKFVVFGGRVKVEEFVPDRDYTLFYNKVLKDVYEIDPNSHWSVGPTKEVNKPMAPKTLPRVEEVDGKIYVFQEGSSFYHWEIPDTLFEVYDIAFNTWNELPKIPSQGSWSEKEMAIVKSGRLSAALLVGYKIYILFGKRGEEIFCCFDTETNKWEEKFAFNLQKCFRKTSLCFPDMGKCVSRIDDLDDGLNIILFHHDTAMLAYLIDDLGHFLCYQFICDFSLKEDIGLSLVDFNGGGRMCLVISDGCDNGDFIIIQYFELKLKDGFKEEVKILQDAVSAGGGDGSCGVVPVQKIFLTVQNITKQQSCTLTEEDVFIGFRDAFLL